MDIISIVWIISIIATIAMCAQKKLSGWWVFWAFFFGPVVAVMAYLSEEQPGKVNPDLVRNLQTEITTLKLEVRELRRRVFQLEKGEGVAERPPEELPDPETEVPLTDEELADLAESPTEPEQDPEPVPVSPPEIESRPMPRVAVSQPATPRIDDGGKQPSSAEINFGQFWLNKIGIVIFTLGVGFFISYSFQYFSPLLKDLLGYTVAGVLFYLGRRFEKQDNLRNYGLALLGAGWALTYFTTYALYHFEASRIVHSQAVDVGLLFVVAVGMMLHALRAKSETMMMVSLGVAYVTSLIGEVTTFTFISSVILGCVVVFLLYRFQWIKTLFLGIGMTYGIHFLFVGPAIGSGNLLTLGDSNPGPSLELAFLAAYAVLYFTGTHLVKGRSRSEQDCVAAGNFINFILFFALSSPVFQEFYPERRVITLAALGCLYLAAGVWMRYSGRRRMYASDIVIALAAFTLATYLQYLPLTALLIWLIQTPFILLAGVRFRDRVLEYAGYILSGLCLLRFMDLFDWGMGDQAVRVFGQGWTLMEFTALAGAAAMAACYAIYRWDVAADQRRPLAANVFCALAVLYGTAWLWSISQGPWLVLCLLCEVAGLVGAGRFAREPVLKAAGLLLTVISLVVLAWHEALTGGTVMVDILGRRMTNAEWTCFFGGLALWTAFGLSHAEAVKVAREGSFNVDNHVYSFFGTALLNIWLCRVLSGYWITVGLAVEAVVLVNAAMLFTLKRLRIYAYVLLAASLVRFIGMDDYQGIGAWKWWLIIFEMAVFLGLYLMSVLKKAEEDREVKVDEMETVMLFIGFMIVLVTAVFQHADASWRSLCLGGSAVGMVALGLGIKDRVARLGGFLILGLALLRIVFVDLAKLTTIYKIISFIAIGALLLGLSFLYNKYFSEGGGRDASRD